MQLEFSVQVKNPPRDRKKECVIVSFSGLSAEYETLCTDLGKQQVLKHVPFCEVIYFSYFAPYIVEDTGVEVCKKWETWHVKVAGGTHLGKAVYLFPKLNPSVVLKSISLNAPLFRTPSSVDLSRAACILQRHKQVTQSFYFHNPYLSTRFNNNCNYVNSALLYTAIDPDTPGDLYWAYIARRTKTDVLKSIPQLSSYLYWQYLLEMAMARLGLWGSLTNFAKDLAKTPLEALDNLRTQGTNNENLTLLLETACDMFRYLGIHHSYSMDIRLGPKQVQKIDDNEPLKPIVGGEGDCESVSMMVWILYIQFMTWWEKVQGKQLCQRAPLLQLLGSILYCSYSLCAMYVLQKTDQDPSTAAHVTCMLLPQRKGNNTKAFLIESTAMYGGLHIHKDQTYAGKNVKQYYTWQLQEHQDPLYKKLRSRMQDKNKGYSYRYSFSQEEKRDFYSKVCSYVCVPETTGMLGEYKHQCPKDKKGKIGVNFSDFCIQHDSGLPEYEEAVPRRFFKESFDAVWSDSWERTGPPVVAPLLLHEREIKKGLQNLRKTVCRNLRQTVVGVISGKKTSITGRCQTVRGEDGCTLRTYQLPLYSARLTDLWAKQSVLGFGRAVYTTFSTLST